MKMIFLNVNQLLVVVVGRGHFYYFCLRELSAVDYYSDGESSSPRKIQLHFLTPSYQFSAGGGFKIKFLYSMIDSSMDPTIIFILLFLFFSYLSFNFIIPSLIKRNDSLVIARISCHLGLVVLFRNIWTTATTFFNCATKVEGASTLCLFLFCIRFFTV